MKALNFIRKEASDVSSGNGAPFYQRPLTKESERVLEAERALDAYLHGGEYNPTLYRRLNEAVKIAREELFALFTPLRPAR